jgi:hypothetical protein
MRKPYLRYPSLILVQSVVRLQSDEGGSARHTQPLSSGGEVIRRQGLDEGDAKENIS